MKRPLPLNVLLKIIASQLKPVLEKSDQGIYIYLDDTHMVCNKKYANLLGYKSQKEWAQGKAPLSDFIEEDQQTVINAYMKATRKMSATSVHARVKNVKTNTIVNTSVIIVPLTYEVHLFTIHFFGEIT